MKQENDISEKIMEQIPGIGLKNRGIVVYLLKCSLEHNGLAICTFREIQRETGRSLSTIHMVVRQLRESGFVRVIRSGVYQVSQNGTPEYCVSLDSTKADTGNIA